MTLGRHLTPDQIATLAALVDAIVPPDGFPGGTGLGVLEYLDLQFAGDLADRLDGYRMGLAALFGEARLRFGWPFADLAPRRRAAPLRTVESGGVRGSWPVDPRAFLADAVGHVMEGCYGGPAAWPMLGFAVTA